MTDDYRQYVILLTVFQMFLDFHKSKDATGNYNWPVKPLKYRT